MPSTLFYAIYDSAAPDPTVADDVANPASAWHTTNADYAGSETSPEVDGVFNFQRIYDLADGDYKCAMAWQTDDGYYSSAVVITPQFTILDGEARYVPWMDALSPVAWWRLGHSSGDAVSEVGSYDLSPNGSPTLEEPGFLISGDNDFAVDFDGVDDFFSGAHANFRGSDTSGTVQAILSATADAKQHFLSSSKSANSDDRAFFSIENTGQIRIAFVVGSTVNDAKSVDTEPTFLDGQPHHIAAVSDGSAWTLYADGRELDAVYNLSNSGEWFGDVPNRENVAIGASNHSGSPSNFVKGKIDEVVVYDKALTFDEYWGSYASYRHFNAYESEMLKHKSLFYAPLNDASDAYSLTTDNFTDLENWHSMSSHYGDQAVAEIDSGLKLRVKHLSTLSAWITKSIGSKFILTGDFDIELNISDFDAPTRPARAIMRLLSTVTYDNAYVGMFRYNSADYFWSWWSAGTGSHSRSNNFGAVRFQRTGSNLIAWRKDGNGSYVQMRSGAFVDHDVVVELDLLMDPTDTTPRETSVTFDSFTITSGTVKSGIRTEAQRGHRFAIALRPQNQPLYDQTAILDIPSFNSMAFDGVDQHIPIPWNTNATSFKRQLFTWVFWFNTSYTGGTQDLLTLWPENAAAVSAGLRIGINASGQIQGSYGTAASGSWDTGVSTITGLNDGENHMVAVSFDHVTNNRLRIFVDGNLDSTHVVSNDIDWSDGSGVRPFYAIGARPDGSGNPSFCFNGRMSGVSFHEVELTENEVKKIYLAGKDLYLIKQAIELGAEHYWLLNDAGTANGYDYIDNTNDTWIHSTSTGASITSDGIATCDFPGTGGSLELDDKGQTFLNGKSAVSLSFWVDPTSYSQSSKWMLEILANGTDAALEIIQSNTTIQTKISPAGNGSQITANASANPTDQTAPLHVGISIDCTARELNVYFNGVLNRNETWTAGNGAHASSFNIGTPSPTYKDRIGNYSGSATNISFDGLMSHWAFYPSVLSQQDFEDIYNLGVI